MKGLGLENVGGVRQRLIVASQANKNRIPSSK